MENEIKQIKSLMETILLHSKDGVNFRPIKGTTKQQCYNVLGKIQSLLKTNVLKIETQNTIEYDGKKYYAVIDENGNCRGCAFYDDNPCPPLHETKNGYCTPSTRPDNRNIIWVPEYKCIDENTIFVQGKKYIAVSAPNFEHCDGCDLLPKGKTGCDGLWKIDKTMPNCSAMVRCDRRDIIWKQQNEQK